MSFSISSLLLFLVAVSLDSLTAGFSYGTERVHIKALSLLFLACVPALFITAAGGLGEIVGSLLRPAFFPSSPFSCLPPSALQSFWKA